MHSLSKILLLFQRPTKRDLLRDRSAAKLDGESLCLILDCMATYIYETIPESEEETPIRFEYTQSMSDAPLTRHPESGAPVKRVITGGYGFNVSGSEKSVPSPSMGDSCCNQGGCGCPSN